MCLNILAIDFLSSLAKLLEPSPPLTVADVHGYDMLRDERTLFLGSLCAILHHGNDYHATFHRVWLLTINMHPMMLLAITVLSTKEISQDDLKLTVDSGMGTGGSTEAQPSVRFPPTIECRSRS